MAAFNQNAMASYPGFGKPRTSSLSPPQSAPYSAYRPGQAQATPQQSQGSPYTPLPPPTGDPRGAYAPAAPSQRPPPFQMSAAQNYGDSMIGRLNQSFGGQGNPFAYQPQQYAPEPQGYQNQGSAQPIAPPTDTYRTPEYGGLPPGRVDYPSGDDWGFGPARTPPPPGGGRSPRSQYGTPPAERGGVRFADWRDGDKDGVDDRDQDGPGQPGYGPPGQPPARWPEIDAGYNVPRPPVGPSGPDAAEYQKWRSGQFRTMEYRGPEGEAKREADMHQRWLEETGRAPVSDPPRPGPPAAPPASIEDWLGGGRYPVSGPPRQPVPAPPAQGAPPQAGPAQPPAYKPPPNGTTRSDPHSGKMVTYKNGQWSWEPNPISGPQPYDTSRFGDGTPPGPQPKAGQAQPIPSPSQGTAYQQPDDPYAVTDIGSLPFYKSLRVGDKVRKREGGQYDVYDSSGVAVETYNPGSAEPSVSMKRTREPLFLYQNEGMTDQQLGDIQSQREKAAKQKKAGDAWIEGAPARLE